MDVEHVARKIVSWLQEQVREAGGKGVILGLSGGIDSAVTAGLCVRAFPETTLALIMPCHSTPEDEDLAREVANAFHLPTEKIDLSGIYDLLLVAYGQDPQQVDTVTRAAANLKSRLRMITLYYFANLKNYLVVGTGNRSELAVGYFTKYGDGAVDLLPLGNLVKRQVRELAEYLGVPRSVIDRPPSAGLWPGQTDEGEMGLTYQVLDHYLLTGEAPSPWREKIQKMQQASQHKRQVPPIAPLD